MANLETDEPLAGGSIQQMADCESMHDDTVVMKGVVPGGASDKNSSSEQGNRPQASGKEKGTKGASNSSIAGCPAGPLEGDSNTPTSDEDPLRKACIRSHCSAYNGSPELESDQDGEDELEKLLSSSSLRGSTSIGIQTEHDEEFPSLRFLQAFLGATGKVPLLFNSSILQPQQLPPSSSLHQSTPSIVDHGDPNRTEGTLQLVIQNFRHMSDTVRGPSKMVQSIPWRIMVMPRQHVVQKKGTQKCLGFFLQCCPDAYSDLWSCQASAELRLISQKPGVIPNFTRKTSHTYTAKENDWGYSCFMTWADILDENQGYIKDDKVILEVHVKAEPPKNILSHKEFQKKIQDYKRLADVQCQRGLIDKAIECNAQALKFCKDKDSLCKTELETQKTQLIEMKLKQSIERIEKGTDGTKGVEDDPTSNIAALRSALSGGTKPKTMQSKDVQKSNKGAAQKETPAVHAATPPKPTDDEQKATLRGSTIKEDVEHAGAKATATVTTSVVCDTPSQMAEKRVEEASALGKALPIDNKALIALGHFNKALLDSDELDYMGGLIRERQLDEEELLPDQIKHYLQHLSEKGKEAARLKRFSIELEHLAFPLDSDSGGAEVLFNELSMLAHEGDADTLDFEQIGQCLEAFREKKGRKAGPSLKQLQALECSEFYDICAADEGRKRRSGRVETAELGCQTDFVRHPTREAVRLAQQQLLAQQPNADSRQPPSKVCIDGKVPFSTLPARQRKKVTTKKTASMKQQPPLPPQQPPYNPVQQQLGSLPSNPAQVAHDGIDAGVPNKNSLGIMPPFITSPADFSSYPMDAKAAAYLQATGFNTLAGFTPEMATKLQEVTAQQLHSAGGGDAFSRQYIAEWLKANTTGSLNCTAGRKQPLIVARGDAPGVNPAGVVQEPGNADAPFGQMANIGCLNPQTVQQRVIDFLTALESNSNLREMRNSIDRLMAISGEDGDNVSLLSTNNSSNRDLASDLPNGEYLHPPFQLPFGTDEDVLSRECKQAEMMIAARLDTLMYQLNHASLPDIIDRVESRVRGLSEKIRELSASEKAVRSTADALKNSELQAQKALQMANEKFERANQQLKERKGELKKLEKRLKSEAQLAAENSELQERADTLKKEVANLQKQLTEEQLKYKRDTQSLADSKKHLSAELNQLKSSRSNELQKLNSQLEDKTSALKTERKNNASSMATLLERAKRAEIALLEHKLDEGLRVLERAKDDCLMQTRSLEEQLKRPYNSCEQEVIKKNIAEWESKREEIAGLVTQANKEFTAHITSIRAGKQVPQLAKIQVPKPPPCPRLHPMPPTPSVASTPLPPSAVAGPSAAARLSPLVQQQQHMQAAPANASAPLPLDRKVITPPNSRARALGGALTPSMVAPQQHPMPLMGPASTMQSPATHYSSSSIPNSTNVTPIKYQQSAQAHSQLPPSSPPLQQSCPAIAPIGVRPANYHPHPQQNGMPQVSNGPSNYNFTSSALDLLSGHMPPSQYAASGLSAMPQGAAAQRMQSFQAAHQQPAALSGDAARRGGTGSSESSASLFPSNGWSGWGTESSVGSNIDFFSQGRSFGPLGSDFGNRSIGNNNGANPTSTAMSGGLLDTCQLNSTTPGGSSPCNQLRHTARMPTEWNTFDTQ